jgi:type III secretory pathway component EscU
MFRVARQMMQLVATLVLLLRRWSNGRNRAPYLSAGCLVVVLAGAVTLIATCCLAGLLFVALLFMKGAIP